MIYLFFILSGFAASSDYFDKGKILFDNKKFEKSKIFFEKSTLDNEKQYFRKMIKIMLSTYFEDDFQVRGTVER